MSRALTGLTLLLGVAAYTLGLNGPSLVQDTIPAWSYQVVTGEVLTGDSCPQGINPSKLAGAILCEDDTPCQDIILATLKGECWTKEK